MNLTAQDTFEILALPVRVAAAMDDRDPDAFADCWTEDTYFDYAGTIYDSREAVYGYAKEHMVSDEAKGKRHFAQNIRITAVQDDKVYMKSNLLMLETDEIPFIVATGAIEEEVVKTPVGWKFSKRIFRLDPGFSKLIAKWQASEGA